ncbi:hypothetical protein Tco_1552062, partial [Tanacetum coccineum]
MQVVCMMVEAKSKYWRIRSVPPLAGGGSNPVSAAVDIGTSTQEGNQIRNPSGI